MEGECSESKRFVLKGKSLGKSSGREMQQRGQKKHKQLNWKIHILGHHVYVQLVYNVHASSLVGLFCDIATKLSESFF